MGEENSATIAVNLDWSKLPQDIQHVKTQLQNDLSDAARIPYNTRAHQEAFASWRRQANEMEDWGHNMAAMARRYLAEQQFAVSTGDFNMARLLPGSEGLTRAAEYGGLSGGITDIATASRILGIPFPRIARFGMYGLGAYGAYKALRYVHDEAAESLSTESNVRIGLQTAGSDNAASQAKQIMGYADSLSRSVTLSDEAIANLMAQGARLGGFMGPQLRQVTETAIGLANRLEIDVTSAMTLATKAAGGHTEMLARYGLALDEGMSKEDKWNTVRSYAAAGLLAESEKMKTLTGSTVELKKALSDLAEEISKPIIGPWRESMAGLLQWSTQRVRGLTDRVFGGAEESATPGQDLYHAAQDELRRRVQEAKDKEPKPLTPEQVKAKEQQRIASMAALDKSLAAARIASIEDPYQRAAAAAQARYDEGAKIDQLKAAEMYQLEMGVVEREAKKKQAENEAHIKQARSDAEGSIASLGMKAAGMDEWTVAEYEIRRKAKEMSEKPGMEGVAGLFQTAALSELEQRKQASMPRAPQAAPFQSHFEGLSAMYSRIAQSAGSSTDTTSDIRKTAENTGKSVELAGGLKDVVERLLSEVGMKFGGKAG